MGQKSVAAAVLNELTAAGTKTVFGIPGSAISPMFDALLDRPDLRLIVARHETMAVFMAMGAYYATGAPGLVLTTAGPGLTNALTGVASALAEGVPLVVVAGEVAKSVFGRGVAQDGSAGLGDTVALGRYVTKFAAQMGIAGSARHVARKALAAAMSARCGPSLLTLPLDVGCGMDNNCELGGKEGAHFVIDEMACRRAAAALSAAKNPLLFLGGGARDARSRRALRRLAEHVSSPVMVTPKGKGVFPEDHPLYLGVFGIGGHERAMAFLQGGSPDVVLVAGASLNDVSTNAWSPLLQATDFHIHVDVDGAHVGRNYRTDIGLLGPIDEVVSCVLNFAHPVVRDSRARGSEGEPARIAAGEGGPMSAREVMAVIGHHVPDETVFVCDIGGYFIPAINVLRIKDQGEFIICLGTGSMGSGIGVAIGHQLASPGRRVLCITGDGGFLMYGNELVTAVKHGVSLTVCVMNDGCYGMCKRGHENVYGRSPDLSTQTVDFSRIAEAMGAVGHVVHTPEELRKALTPPVGRPTVIDIRFDAELDVGSSQRDVALRQFMARAE